MKGKTGDEIMNELRGRNNEEMLNILHGLTYDNSDKYIIQSIRDNISKILVSDKKFDENVIVLPSNLLDKKLGDKEGLITDQYTVQDIFDLTLMMGNDIPRFEAEYNYDYRQIITQFIITYGNKLFIARKIKGDDRLVGKAELIGGHLTDIDNVFGELYEELEIGVDSVIDEIILKGILKLNRPKNIANEHMGLIFHVELNKDDIDIHYSEKDKLEGEWVNINDLDKVENKNEWLQLVCDNIQKLIQD